MSSSPPHLPTLPPYSGGPAAPRVGDMLGAYRLDAIAGEGGMGRVFAATHTKLGKKVAVKVLRRRYASRPDAIARFFQEARAVNVIRHPNIVEITDFVEGPTGGDSYYIMEWLDGLSLAARLARDSVVPWPEVVTIGRQVASALAAVHRAGLIHRDLKPDNIFTIEQDGHPVVKILDFGVATLATQAVASGPVAGTPAYFSPEAAAGRPLDGRSDIYSLGVMLYELLAGHPPFQGNSLSEYVMKHMTASPRPLAEVVLEPLPPALVEAIGRCLEKDPDRRFQTMDELEEVLATLEQTDVEFVEKPQAAWRPRRLALAALFVFLASAAVTRGVRALRGAEGSLVEDAAQPARIVVRIESDPAGAEVYREGVVLGTTPCAVQLLPGPLVLKIARRGFRSSELAFDPRPGRTYAVKLEPELPPPAPKTPPPPRMLLPPLPAPATPPPPPPTEIAPAAPPAQPVKAGAHPHHKKARPSRKTINPFD